MKHKSLDQRELEYLREYVWEMNSRHTTFREQISNFFLEPIAFIFILPIFSVYWALCVYVKLLSK